MPEAAREPSDVDLLLAYRRGDVNAFARLYDRYGDRLFVYARSLSGDGESAEDVVQDAFLRLLRLEDPRPDAPLGPFLFTVVRNLCLDAGRREAVRGRPWGSASAAPDAPGVLDLALDVEDLLRELPADQREVVLLKVYGGLTFAEIAEVTGLKLPTVASRYRYALEKLAGLLEREGSAR